VAGNLDDTVPPDWMTPAAVDQVIGFVAAMGMSRRRKQQLFYRWAFTVGHTVTPEELARVLGETS